MKDLEPFENSALFRMANWQKFIESEEWNEYKIILKERENYLNRQVLINVCNRKFDEATRLQAKAEEVANVVRVAERQLSKIKEEADGG